MIRSACRGGEPMVSAAKAAHQIFHAGVNPAPERLPSAPAAVRAASCTARPESSLANSAGLHHVLRGGFRELSQGHFQFFGGTENAGGATPVAASRPRHDELWAGQPRLSLNCFVVGTGNEAAYRMCAGIAERPASREIRALFMYGRTGMGKTHLLAGLSQRLKPFADGRDAVIFVTARSFAAQYRAASRSRGLSRFHARLRQAAFILIDDVHELAGMPGAQAALIHAFNRIEDAGGRLVFTSDRPAKDLAGFGERLLGRLRSCVHVKLDIPDAATRRCIADAVLGRLGLAVTDEVRQRLANSVNTSVRDLVRLTCRAAEIRNPGDDVIDELLSANVSTSPRRVTLDDVDSIVSAACGISPEMIRSTTCARPAARARHICFFLARRALGTSLAHAAVHYGRTQAAVSLGARSVQTKARNSEPLRNTVLDLARKLDPGTTALTCLSRELI
jgi:chromosomal replication initiator protein